MDIGTADAFDRCLCFENSSGVVAFACLVEPAAGEIVLKSPGDAHRFEGHLAIQLRAQKIEADRRRRIPCGR